MKLNQSLVLVASPLGVSNEADDIDLPGVSNGLVTRGNGRDQRRTAFHVRYVLGSEHKLPTKLVELGRSVVDDTLTNRMARISGL